METRNSLRSVKQTDTNLSRYIEAAVRNGHPILIEDVGETLEAVLEPVLNKNITYDATGKQAYIKLGGASEGDEGTPYNPDFKLYITTKMSNPHYLPEVCIKVRPREPAGHATATPCISICCEHSLPLTSRCPCCMHRHVVEGRRTLSNPPVQQLEQTRTCL